jgi:hypothetical protein
LLFLQNLGKKEKKKQKYLDSYWTVRKSTNGLSRLFLLWAAEGPTTSLGTQQRHSLILIAGSSARRHRRSRLVVFFLVVVVVVMADLLAPAPQIAAILEL